VTFDNDCFHADSKKRKKKLEKQKKIKKRKLTDKSVAVNQDQYTGQLVATGNN